MGLIGVGCWVMRMMRAVIIKNPARFAPHENNFSGILMKFRAVAFASAKMRHKCLIYPLIVQPLAPYMVLPVVRHIFTTL